MKLHHTSTRMEVSKKPMERIVQALPPFNGRLAGFLYLLYLITSTLTEVFMEQSGAGVRVMSTDATATASSILSHEFQFRLGLAFNLLSILSYIGAVALFYRMFKPVSRNVALIGLLFALVRIGIWVSEVLVLLVPLAILTEGPYLNVFDATQLHALALLAVNVSTQAYSTGFVFEGPFWIAIGYLWFRSTFLPRSIGALFALAGVSYLLFLSLPVANALLLEIGVFSGIAELSMFLWLLIKGVNPQRWIEQATASRNHRRTQPAMI